MLKLTPLPLALVVLINNLSDKLGPHLELHDASSIDLDILKPKTQAFCEIIFKLLCPPKYLLMFRFVHIATDQL
jgi:hypothetical protein